MKYAGRYGQEDDCLFKTTFWDILYGLIFFKKKPSCTGCHGSLWYECDCCHNVDPTSRKTLQKHFLSMYRAPKQLASWMASLQPSSRGLSSPATIPASSVRRSRPYNRHRRQVECASGSGVPIHGSALRCEPILGKGLLARADSRRQVLQLDALRTPLRERCRDGAEVCLGVSYQPPPTLRQKSP